MLLHQIEALKRAGRVEPADVVALRREAWGDDAIHQGEAEALVALDEALAGPPSEWTMFYLEALTEFAVKTQSPRGYVDQAGADWLAGQLTRDGQLKGATELELLVRILERAESAPASLALLAMDKVRQAALADGRIGAEEVALLRRVLYAACGDGNFAVTRAEAEVMLDINDAVRGAENDPAWSDLFAKALGAAVMTVSTYQPVAREDALRREAWLKAPESDPVGLLRETARAAFSIDNLVESAREMFNPGAHDADDWRAQNIAEVHDLAAAEPVDASEAAWLFDRLGRDGVFDEAEAALMAFLRAEAPSMGDALSPLRDAAPGRAVFGKRGAAA